MKPQPRVRIVLGRSEIADICGLRGFGDSKYREGGFFALWYNLQQKVPAHFISMNEETMGLTSAESRTAIQQQPVNKCVRRNILNQPTLATCINLPSNLQTHFLQFRQPSDVRSKLIQQQNSLTDKLHLMSFICDDYAGKRKRRHGSKIMLLSLLYRS